MLTDLLSLPVEIIQLICQALDPKDLASFRLTCKALDRISLQPFGFKTLAEIRTDLGFKSLQRLHKIGNLDRLAPCVECMRVTHVDYELGRGLRWNQKLSQYPATSLIGSDWLRDILVKKLVNCRSFRIDTSYERGASVEDSRLTPTHVIAVIFSIFAEYQLPIRSFVLEKGELGSHLDTGRLQKSQDYIDQCKSALMRLESLGLDVMMHPDHYDWARNLIMLALNLRKLSLGESSFNNSFLKCLNPQQLPLKLNNFSLRATFTTEAALSRFLCHSQETLSVLRLTQVCLEADDSWITLFRKLKGNFLHLERFCINKCKQRTTAAWIMLHFFRLSDMGNNSLVPGFMREFFDDYECLTYDLRLLKGLQRPCKLLFEQDQDEVIGVSYEGLDIDLLLDILAETAEGSIVRNFS